MGFSSLQSTVEDHMDNSSSDWFQGTANEETRMESSPPLGDMMRPVSVDQKKLRPQQDQPIKCPRCDSTHTKFCYYNNYSLSQPRYFCKTCRRYWTKGGSLRNIPVGGGCRKNKRVSVKKSSDHDQSSVTSQFRSSSHDGTDLQLSFPREVQFSQLNALLASNGNGNGNFVDSKYNSMIENNRQFDFLENKFGDLLGNSRNHDFMGNTDLGLMSGLTHAASHHDQVTSSAFHDQFSHYGISFTGNNGHTMLPSFDDTNAIEMKPNKHFLSLDWHDHQGYSDVGKESYGYFNCVGSWNGFMNGYGSSATNPLV